MFANHKINKSALLKAGALQTAILTSANFSIIATDEDGVIQLFNVGAQRMLGYEAAEVVNKVRPSEMHDALEVKQRAMKLSAELNVPIAAGFEALAYKASRSMEDIYETTYLCKDGSRLPVIVSITALRNEVATIIGYLIIGTDNSLRKTAEIELKNAMLAAETASNAKSEFISRMSHELRTPLNAILGFAQLIETGTPAPTQVQQRNLDQILKGGWYLLELINEILDLALVESGRLVLSMEPVRVSDVLNECRLMVEPQALRSGITVQFAPADPDIHVLADRTRFKQVVLNLLVNAIKYNRPQGTVEVSLAPAAHTGVRIQVRDNGLGMTPAQMAQLFQPFNRLGREVIAEEGTGIGLAVTKRLIELMGGVIGVESSVDVGSNFWVALQRGDTPQTQDFVISNPAPLATEPGTTEVRYTVLYVEDNPDNLELVEQMIARRADAHFISAPEAAQGIALARAHLPDVILMDINLPGISGMDAMKILRADPRTAHIPVLALSANAVPRDIEAALQAGFLNYITKPIHVKDFMKNLDVVLHQQQRKSP